jgi:hypothetical protein
MNSDKKPVHPFDLFTELVADLGFVLLEAQDVLDWIAETKDKRCTRHLSRMAILYLSFAAEATIDLRAGAGRMTYTTVYILA